MPNAVYDDQETEPKKPQVGSANDGEGTLSDAERKSFEEITKNYDSPESEDIARKEEAVSKGKSLEDDEPEPTSFYNPGAAIGSATPFSKFQVYFGRNRKGFLTGGIVGLFTILIFMGISAIVPNELIHIKEVVAQNIGGVQENILDKRRMRILQKAYFFRDDGKFAGYKQKGTLFAFLENRKTNKLVTDLEAKGYTVDADTKDGKWTGKFTSITGPDGVKINDSDSLWSRRSALKTVINDTYPAKSALWRNYQTSLMYKRYGLTRGNWWTDNAATRKLTSAEERLKQKIRNAMNGDNVSRPNSTVTEPAKNEDGTPVDPAEAQRASELAGATEQAIQDEISTDGNTPRLNGDLMEGLEQDPVKAVGGGIFNIIKITGVVDTSCQVIGTANTIAKTSRAIKALQLAQYSSIILSAADGMKTGKVDSKTINDIMIAVNGLDPQTKKNFFGSGGWLSVATKKPVKSTYATTYNAGGGFSGSIKKVLDIAYGVIPGGRSGVSTTCSTSANPLVQIGSAIVGVGAIIFSGGGVAVGQLVAQAGLQVGKQLLIAYGAQLAIKAAAGTIIDGTEVGERMGDAFMSGTGTLFAMNGASVGMKPLTNQEYAYQQNEYQEDLKAQIASKPVWEQLTMTENPNSLTNKYIDTVAVIKNNGLLPFIAKLPSQIISIFGKKVNAEEASACEEEDINKAQIKTDNFCNPIYGNTDQELDKIDPMDNLIWMYENHKVDANGNPLDDYADYISKCFESQYVNTLFTNTNDFDYSITDECYGKGEVRSDGIGLFERYRAFRLDSTLLTCLNEYLDTGACADNSTTSTSEPSNTTSATIASDGFAFPVVASKSVIQKSGWCYKSQTSCHHDYNAADIMAPTGTTVVAARAGKVVVAHDRDVNSTVTIKGDDGLLYFYAHNGSGSIRVKVGDTVTAGQQIAAIGTSEDTGNGSAPHLHLDILPSSYNSHPECGGAECSNYPFIDPQPVLIKVFEQVP